MTQHAFFMHIAKTAGSYVNRLFGDALGETNIVVHAESKLRDPSNFKRLITEQNVKFFSGHLYLRLWDEFSKHVDKEFKLITVVRDPIEQIASHILWLDHYNLDRKRGEYQRLSESHRRLVDLIQNVNFDDPGHLDHFLTHLPPAGLQLLDNCQSRYFLCGPGSPILNHEPITLAHTSAIVKSCNRFDLILVQNDLRAGVLMINSLLGTNLVFSETRVNEAKAERTIDTSNPVIRALLSKRSTTDLWLWRHATAWNAEAKARYGVLENDI